MALNQNPTPEELLELQELGVELPTSNEDFGSVSRQQESGGDIAAVANNKDDPGGLSLGSSQFIPKTFDDFLKSKEGSKFSPEFKDITPGSKEFGARFKKVVTPEMDKAMDVFIKRRNFKPVEDLAKKKGLLTENPVLREFLLSSSVQHSKRGNELILDNFLKKNPTPEILDDDALIDELFKSRNNYVQGLKSLSPKMKKTLEKRFLVTEPKALKAFALKRREPQSLLAQQAADTPLPQALAPEQPAQPQLLDVEQALQSPAIATPEEIQQLSQPQGTLVAGPAPSPEDLAELQSLGINFAPSEVQSPLEATTEEQAEIDLLQQSSFSTPVQPDVEIQEPESGFLTGLNSGLKQNISGLALAAATGGVQNAKRVALEKAQFDTIPEGLGYITGQLLDPAMIPATLLGGGLFVKGGQLAKAGAQLLFRKSVQEGVKASGNIILRKAVQEAIKQGGKEALKGASKAALKQKLKQETFKQAIIRSAGEAAGGVAARAAVDPTATARSLAAEGAFGTALGIGLRGAGRLLSRTRESKKLTKAFDLMSKRGHLEETFQDAEGARKAVVRQNARRVKAGEPKLTVDPDKVFDEIIVARVGDTLRSGGAKVIKQDMTSPLKLAARIDEAIGTNTFESVAKLVQNANVKDAITLDIGKNLTGIKNKLNKLGRTNADISDLMEHVGRDGLFDPSPNISRGLYQGTLPSTAEQQVLAEFRQGFNQILEFSPEVASRNFFVPRYFKPKEGKVKKGARRTFERVQDAVRGKFEQKRVLQDFNGEIHESDIQVIIDKYAAEQGKVLAYREPVEELGKQIRRLKFLGKDREAESMSKLVADVLNVKDPAVAELFAVGNALDRHSGQLAKMIQSQGLPEEVGDRLFRNTLTLMSETLLFSKPLSTFKNMLQLEVIGPAEVGARYLQIARNPFSKARQVAKAHIDIMKSPTMDYADLGATINKAGTMKMKALDLVRAPFKVTFNAADTANRKRAFAAAYEQWDDLVPQGQIGNVLDGLMPSESALVLKTLENKGEEAAKIVYSLTRSRRINFAYTIADKPEVLRRGLGKFIPFTTWGRNVASRIMQNVSEKNFSKAAIALAAPFVTIEAIRAAGYEIRGIHPFSSAVGMFNPTVSPIAAAIPEVVTEIKDIALGKKEFDPAKSKLLSFTPGLASVKAAAKAQEELEDGNLLGPLGIKESDATLDSEDLPERLINDIFNPYRLKR